MIKIIDKLISPYEIQIDCNVAGLVFTVGIPDKSGNISFAWSGHRYKNLEDALTFISNTQIVSGNNTSVTLKEFAEFYKETNEMLLNTIKV